MMLTREGCVARRKRLWETLPESIEWVLVADPRHVQYLANFWVQPLSFSGGERALLLLARGGRATQCDGRPRRWSLRYHGRATWASRPVGAVVTSSARSTV